MSGVVALVGVDAGVAAPGALAGDGDMEVEGDPDVLVVVRMMSDDGGWRQTVECLVVGQSTQQSDHVSAWNAFVQTEHARASTDAPTALDDRREHVFTHTQTTLLHLAQVC